MNKEMYRIKKLLITFLIIILCLSLAACNKSAVVNKNEQKRNIAFIVKMKSGDYWKTVKMGADTAAKEFNVDIDFNAPYGEEDIEGQIELVNRAIDNKADAIIVAASDYNGLVEVIEKAYDRKIPIIIIDSEVNTEKYNSFIGTDNFDAGKKAAEILISMIGKKGNIAIMGFVKGTGNGEQREKGFSNIISQYSGINVISKEYCLSNIERAVILTKKIIRENEDVDAIVALNAISSIGVAKAIDEMNLAGKVKVVTFDSTPEEIEYLEGGVIQATIIQNPFSMGYLGVKNAVKALEKKDIKKRIDTGSKVINIENMYLPENQKLLFPFVK
ncbi:MAG: substrate-binding domain-containing protein [Maledivibacter sp.]|jgi:ribose transport system substrate-binding protein|nr:substrate-binding domain-containing protein [Maledivibacter sp.]